MSKGIDTTPAQPEPSHCPAWCRQQHLHEAPESDGGFHHDSEPVPLGLEAGEALYVGVAQRVRADARADEAHVELSLVDRTLHLTRAEAATLATRLLQAAEQLA